MQTQTKKINGGELYHEIMSKVSLAVNKFIQKKIHSIGLPSDLKQIVLSLPKKREYKMIMRPTLSYLVYRAFEGKDSIENLSPILAVSELNNYYCYLDNWILDNKNNIGQDLRAIRNVTIASQVLRDLTQIVIEEASVSDNQKRKISQRLAETTIQCYDGQFKDLQMTIDNLSDYSDEKDYLNAYTEKSRLQSGGLYGLSGEIGAILANADQDQTLLARETCSTLGTGLHISNDLGDFAIFQEQDGSFKPYQDQLADIINGRLTFPAYYTLTHGTKQEKEVLQRIIGRTDATLEEKTEVSKVIVESGAYSETRKILNEYYHRFKSQVHQLPQCPERNALCSVGEIIRYNKYLKCFQKLMQGI
jgi:geranylgeranyl pyrophosphate synthase